MQNLSNKENYLPSSNDPSLLKKIPSSQSNEPNKKVNEKVMEAKTRLTQSSDSLPINPKSSLQENTIQILDDSDPEFMKIFYSSLEKQDKNAPDQIHTMCKYLSTTAQALSGSIDDLRWLASFFKENETELKQLSQEIKSIQSQLQGKHLTPHQLKDLSTKLVEIEKRKRSLSNSFPQIIENNDNENAQCGTKHQNLVKMDSLAQAFPLKGLKIPLPQGIPNDKTSEFLRDKAPILFEKWEELKNLYRNFSDEEKKSTFLKDPLVLKLLEEIDTGLKNIFEEPIGQSYLASHERWLSEIKDRGSYLMVRSSGAEDSNKTANAGGNVSVSYVSPTLPTFSTAVGLVLRSYFSISSLQNRINADTNPFEEELQFSATAQELIGEKIGGEENAEQIPRSLVFFSNEECYVGSEKFRIARGSVALGHGEGVVGNLGIASDTFLILYSAERPEKLYVFYDNRMKPKRLAPVKDPETGEISLQKVKNDSQLAKAPALNKQMIEKLFTWGLLTESLFGGKPVDGEFVIKEGVIYPVQARPTQRVNALPTYVDFQKVKEQSTSPIKEKIQGEIIVSGKANVVEIKDKKEILYAPTLEEAERLFEKGNHQLVIVSTEEPANSHPVVNFSWMGIPCLFVPHAEEALNLIGKIDNKQAIAACVQTGCLYLWDRGVSIAACTSSGYAIHPAKIAVSRMSQENQPLRLTSSLEAPKEIKELILHLRAEETRDTALDILKTHSWIVEFYERRQALELKMKGMKCVPQEVQTIAKAAKSLEKRMERTFQEAQHAFAADSGRVLEPLFHAKAIETIIIAPATKGNALSQYSLLSIQDSFAAAEKIIAYQEKFGGTARFTDLLLDGSKTPVGMEEKWEAFLYELENSPKQDVEINALIGAFRETISTLGEVGALPNWLTFFFADPSNESLSIRDKLRIFSLSPAERENLHFFVEGSARIAELKEQVGRFGNPEQFPKAWKDLQEEVEQWKGDKFAKKWEKLSPIGRAIAIEGMGNLVDLFDTSIKTMKGGPSFSKIDQVKIFKEMLLIYHSISIDWFTKISEAGEGLPTHVNWAIHHILESVGFGIVGRSEENIEELSPSKEFSVAAAVIGTRVDFSRHYPHSLEDDFTLVHQNLLVAISNLTLSLIPNLKDHPSLPELMQYALTNVSGLRGNPPKITGIQVKDNELLAKITVPLNHHSGTIEFLHHKEKKSISISGKLLGDARERWPICLNLLEILNKTKTLPLASSPKLSDEQLLFSWEIEDIESLQFALNIYQWLGEFSVAYTKKEMEEFFLEKAPKLFEGIEKMGNSDALKIYLLETCRSPLSGIPGSLFTTENAKEKYKDLVENPPMGGKSTELGIAAYRSLSTQDQRYLLDYIVDSQNNPHFEFPDKKEFKLLQHYCEQEQLEGNFTDTRMMILNEAEKQKGFSYPFSKIRSAILTSTTLDLKNSIDNGEEYEKALSIAKHGILSSNGTIGSTSLDLFLALFKKGQGFKEAIEMASQGLLSKKYQTTDLSMKLFNALFENGQGFEEGMAVAEKGIMNSDVDIRSLHYNLLINLLTLHATTLNPSNVIIEKDKIFLKAFQIAQNSLLNQEINIQEYAIKLFLLMVQNTFHLDEINMIMEEFEKKQDKITNISFAHTILNLFQELVNKGRAFKNASNILKIFNPLWSYGYPDIVFKLWINLINNGQFEEDALTLAVRNLSDHQKEIRKLSLELFMACLKKGFGIDQGIQFAQRGLNSYEPDRGNQAFQIFSTLFENELGLNEAALSAKQGLQDGSKNVRNQSLKLFSLLFDRGYGFKEAALGAADGFLRENKEIRLDSLQLFLTLFDNGEGFEQAVIAAQEGAKSWHKEIREDSMELCAVLLEYGYVVEIAPPPDIKEDDSDNNRSLDVSW